MAPEMHQQKLFCRQWKPCWCLGVLGSAGKINETTGAFNVENYYNRLTLNIKPEAEII